MEEETSYESSLGASGDIHSIGENVSINSTASTSAEHTPSGTEKGANNDPRNGMEQLSDEERKLINLILNGVKKANLKNEELRNILYILSKGNMKILNKEPKHIKNAATFIDAFLQMQEIKAKKILEIFEKHVKLNRLSFEEMEDLNERKKKNAMKYQTSGGYDTVSGVFYTLVLAKLLGFLALTQGYEFQIALEYKPGGKFDDLLFMLKKKDSNNKYQCYHFQLKRKEKESTITIENDLFPHPNPKKKVKYDGPYNLFKYYEDAKQNLQNDTLLVLFSNAELANVDTLPSDPLFPFELPNISLNYHVIASEHEENFKSMLLSEFPNEHAYISFFIKQLRLALGQPNYEKLRTTLRKLLHDKFGYEYDTVYNLLSIHLFTSLSEKTAVASCNNTIKEVICRHISGHNAFYKQLYSRTNILTHEKGIDPDSLNFSQEKTIQLRLKKKQKLSKIDVSVIGPSGSGKNELVLSYLSRMENVIQFKHIISLNAESEETLHISLCEIAAMFMLNTEWKSEIAWDKKQMGIEDILNSLYNFVNNGKVLFIFHNAGSYLKPSDTSIGIYRYLDHFRVSVNFFYIITSNEMISGKHSSYIIISDSKESNAKLYLERLVKSSSRIELFINLDIRKACMILKYNLIAIRLFIGLTEESEKNPIDTLTNMSDISESNIIDYLLEEIVTHLSKTYDSKIIIDTLINIAVLFSRKLSIQLLNQYFLEENDKKMHSTILQCLARMKVFEIDIEEYITIHPVIQNKILEKQLNSEILKIYSRLVDIWSQNIEEKFFLGGIQHVLKVWKSIVTVGLHKFHEEKISILAYKIFLVLRESYNKELYELFYDTTLQKLNNLKWNKNISLCWLEKVDYKIETNINDNCIEEILQKVEEIDESCSTKVKILDLKYHALQGHRDITRKRIQTLFNELENTEKEFTISDIQMFLETCVHYYLTSSNMGLENEKAICFQIFKKYEVELKNKNISTILMNKIKSTLSNNPTDFENLNNVFDDKNFVLDAAYNKINMVYGFVSSYASSIFLGSRFEKLEKFFQSMLQKFGAFHPMVLVIYDKMVKVKLLDEDRKGALEVIQKQKEEISKTLKRNNYPNCKNHYLLQRIKHNIKQIEMQNSNIKYIKNLEKFLGKDHPEYKRCSMKLNGIQYTTAQALPNEVPQNDDKATRSFPHATQKQERNHWLKVQEHDLCHPKYDDLAFSDKIKIQTDIYDKWQDNDEDTPLHKAAREGQLEEIQKLLGQGTDVNTRNHEGETALHKACIYNKFEIVQHLVEKAKANINCIDKLEETPLHKTAFFGRLNIMKYLLNKKADINCRNREGKTLMHKAASASNCNIIEYLISFGVNVNSFDHIDNTPLHDALRICHLDVVKCLVINGAGVNYQNKSKGETALHKAVRTGSLEVVKYLVQDSNANVKIKNIFGRTALNIAKCERLVDIVHFLTSHT